jgi:hypothetical protein
LPFPEWFARAKLRDRIMWKIDVFGRLTAAIVERFRITQLMTTIDRAILKNYSSDGVQSESLELINISYSNILDLKAWVEERDARYANKASNRHVTYAGLCLPGRQVLPSLVCM